MSKKYGRETPEPKFLELEIDLELTTPEQYAEARMAFQMNRLSEEMGKGNTSESGVKRSRLNSAQKWFCIGPITPEQQTALAKRFDPIWTKVLE